MSNEGEYTEDPAILESLSTPEFDDRATGMKHAASDGRHEDGRVRAIFRQHPKVSVGAILLVVLVVLGAGTMVLRHSSGSSVAKPTNLPANMFQVALQLHQAGQLDQALVAYRNVLETDPNSAPVHYNIGQIYQVRGDLPGAIQEYDKALATNPDLVSAIYNRALAFRDQGNNSEAIKGLNAVLAREPDSVGALFNLGNILIAEGKANDGTKLVNRAIELDPTLLKKN